MSMWNVSRSTGAQSTSSTEGTRKSPGEELFSKLDGDGSGGLSASELQSFVDKMSSTTRGALLTTQEAGGSSSSSTSTTSADELLSAMDSDGDGSVSQSELDTYMKANAPAGGPPPPPPPPDEGTGSAAGGDPSSTVFSAIDADGDGSVSQSELADYLAAMKPDTSTSSTDDATSTEDGTTATSTSSSDDIASLFTSIDTDGDGSVSQSELDAFMKTQGPPPPPPHGIHPENDASSSTTATSSTTSSSTSEDTSTSSDTTADLAQQLAAAMAQFAAQAYGRVQSGSEITSLLGAVA